MARSRNIKPGFFKNELLPDISFQGRLLFIGLWTIADKSGRLEYRPRKIKGELFPYEECPVETIINDLERLDFIQVYEVNNNKYIQIVNFNKHQNPHVREADSTIPAPCQYDASTIPALLIPDSLNLIPDSLNTGKPGAISKKFTPPTEQEVVEYFTTNGYKKELAVRAFRGYQEAGWKDSTGKKIRNWKQKMIHVWFRDENKSPNITKGAV